MITYKKFNEYALTKSEDYVKGKGANVDRTPLSRKLAASKASRTMHPRKVSLAKISLPEIEND